MDILRRISDCIIDMGKEEIRDLVLEALEEDIKVEDIYRNGLNYGMTRALEKFEVKEYYLPEIIVCADNLNVGISILKNSGEIKKDTKGKVVLSVVEGDTHEIGKNIVKIMMEASGYDVIDLGVNQESKNIIKAAIDNRADIIGLSSMMTTTMENMKTVISDLNNLKLEKKPKVIIGGGPVNKNFAEEIGADGYSENAPKAVLLIKKLMEEAI